MNHQEIVEMLLDNGFTDGWVLSGNELVVWEHDQNPPAPLVKPKA